MADLRTRPSVFRWLSGLLAGMALVAVVSGLLELLDEHVPVHGLMPLYLLAVLPIAVVWGSGLAVAVSIASAVVFVGLFLTRTDAQVVDPETLLPLLFFLVTAAVVGELTARSRNRTREAARLGEEQAALRRVATLVARATPATEVFEAVLREVVLLCGADLAHMGRYEGDGSLVNVAGWSRVPIPLLVGSRFPLDGVSVAARVHETGAAARVDAFTSADGSLAREGSRLGIRSSVGCPIIVGGRLWGVISASSRHQLAFPTNVEAQLAAFTELVGTAVANTQSQAEITDLLEDQAALRRVATLVARGAPAAEVVSAVAAEVGRVLGGISTVVVRLDADGLVTVIARTGEQPAHMPEGSRWKIEPPVVLAEALATGRAARRDNYGQVPGAFADAVRDLGVRAGVAIPIVVAGRSWGALGVGARERFPDGTEQRLAAFSELVAIAIADAEAAAELAASRARVVVASDEARRHIERDLHDGAQQRLVALGLELSLLQNTVPPEAPAVGPGLGLIADELSDVVDELRELSRGIHPAILSEAGLGAALRTLARRSVIPVELDLRTEARFPEPVEVAAYYVVTEALTNVAKYADASYVTILVEDRFRTLWLSVQDDGVGGADPARGSGLLGIQDRVEALGGSLEVSSPIGEGTLVEVCLPLQPR